MNTRIVFKMIKNYKTKDKIENITPKNKLENWKRYFERNKEYHHSRCREYYLSRMLEWYLWLEENGYGDCKICGFNEHPKAIDFHHIEPEDKEFGIGKFINGRQCNKENQQIILKELKKCMCLCANCHRIIHFKKSEHTNKL